MCTLRLPHYRAYCMLPTASYHSVAHSQEKLSDMEKAWSEHTSTVDFVAGLATLFSGDYDTTDMLNMAVEQ